MAGVGEKLLLVLPRPGHRPGDEAAQQPAEAKQHQQRRRADQQADPHQRAKGGLLEGAVHKGDADSDGALQTEVAHMLRPQHAAVRVGGQGRRHQRQQGILVL